MTSFIGQVRWAKMTSPGGKLTALACHLTKKVNKPKEQTYLPTNIEKSSKLTLKFLFRIYFLLKRGVIGYEKIIGTLLKIWRNWILRT